MMFEPPEPDAIEDKYNDSYITVRKHFVRMAVYRTEVGAYTENGVIRQVVPCMGIQAGIKVP
jgi:hypothetical protein